MEYKGYKNKFQLDTRCKINLYQMDCMELMKQTPDNYYELAITDPPYGGNDAINLLPLFVIVHFAFIILTGYKTGIADYLVVDNYED